VIRACPARAGAGATATVAAAAGPAAAHSPVPGIEGFYAGILHPFGTPDQLLAILAAGLMLGGFALPRTAPAFAALGLGLIGGALAGRLSGDPAPWLLGLAVLAACLAALVPGRARPLAVGLALVAGGLLGWASIPDPGPLRDRVITAAGALTGAMAAILYLAGAADALRRRVERPWMPIALRVGAAWIAAIAMLMLALRWAPA
jgi:hydrogenase/urease accessory protein HupE